MTAIDLVKDLAETVLEKLTQFDTRIKELAGKIPEPYDDNAIQHKIEEVKELIPEPYNDEPLMQTLAELEEKAITELPEVEKYDDSEIMQKLAELEEKAITKLPEPYNDEQVMQKLAELEEKAITELPEIPEIPEPYNDEEVREKLQALEESIDTKLKSLEEQVEKTLADVSKRVTYDVPTPVHYTPDEPIEKGAFVLHQNSLWLNQMEDNDTVPTLENHSYKCLIRAPKVPEHKGLYQEDTEYEFNDIVMKDNASWIRVEGGDNTLPGEGWKLLAKGIRGKKGEKGDKGESVKVEFEAEKSLEDLNDRVLMLEALNVNHSK